MEKKNAIAILLVSSIIWVVILVGSAMILRGTEYKEPVNRVIFIGIILHIQLMNMMLLWSNKRKTAKKSSRPGITIIASAIIWGAVLIATALMLKGTEYVSSVSLLIQGGASSHLILVWAPIGIFAKKYKAKLEADLAEVKK
jgi:hypothetical protein